MKRICFAICLTFCIFLHAEAQDLPLSKAIHELMKDDQFEHSLLGMYVVDVSTGKPVFAHNAKIGMAPASCLKVVTSVTGFELLGSNFQYKTYFGLGDGNLIITGTGDPSLGSWRWAATKETEVKKKIEALLKKQSLHSLRGIYVDDRAFSYQPVPDGWIWQDMGNYYGAGTFGLNWHENQYDLHLQSGEQLGSLTKIVSTTPVNLKSNIYNMITAAGKNTGDNGYIYAAPYSTEIYATGTIPAGEKDFVISGSIPNPPKIFAGIVANIAKGLSIPVKETATFSEQMRLGKKHPEAVPLIDSVLSPEYEKLNYWFLKRSINLYGETFVKSMAQSKFATTEDGVEAIRNFWKTKGIDKGSLNMIDGSGLSTGNRVTPEALVTVMMYAKKQKWFPAFYEGLPEMNNIKMKDGYINGVRSYTGYIQSASGKEYCFAFMVNNFSGSASSVRQKMYRVLDLMKK